MNEDDKKAIERLSKQVQVLTDVVKSLMPSGEIINKDGIPVGTKIHGEVDDIGEIILETKLRSYQVKRIGNDDIMEGRCFNSLSAAAEIFSQIKRKSGWVFWRDAEGKTLKEAYKG